MSRQQRATERPKRRGVWDKFFGATLGNTGRLLMWSLVAVFISIIVEWVGMVFFWDVDHAAVILEKEIGYLSTFNQNLITGLYPSEVAEYFLGGAQWLMDSSGLSSVSSNVSSASMSIAGFFGLAAAAVVNIIFLFAVRLAITVSAIPGLLVVMVVATIDGLTEREIRRECGGNESALVYHSAKGWIWPIFILCSGLYLTSPFSVNPTLVFLPMMCVVGFLMYLTSSRFKKFL